MGSEEFIFKTVSMIMANEKPLIILLCGFVLTVSAILEQYPGFTTKGNISKIRVTASSSPTKSTLTSSVSRTEEPSTTITTTKSTEATTISTSKSTLTSSLAPTEKPTTTKATVKPSTRFVSTKDTQ